MVSRALKEYLQIDLLQPHVITAVRTQGRFGRGQGQEYTEAYVIEYWRPGMKWTRWKSAQGKEVSVVSYCFYGFCVLWPKCAEHSPFNHRNRSSRYSFGRGR